MSESTVPFLLLAQGPTAIAESERIARAAERSIGLSLRRATIPERELLVLTTREVEGLDSASASRGGLSFALAKRPGSHWVARVLPASEVDDVKAPLAANDAFALFDPARDAWTIGRSHPGLRTFYYQVAGRGGIRFAASTQLRGLLAASGATPSVDRAAISRYCCNGFFLDPETPFREFRSLLQGEVLRERGSAGDWQLVADVSLRSLPIASSVAGSPSPTERVRERLIAAVAARTEGSGDVACMLSGGVDSSAVAAIAAKLLGKKVVTYSLVFEDEELSEAKYATAVAKRLATDHHNVLLKQPDFENALDWLLGSLDVPTADAVNSLMICRTVAEAGHAVTLAGVGSDELFGGHECMRRVPRALRLLGMYSHLPRFGRAGVRGLAALALGTREESWLPSHGLRGKFMALLDEERPDPLAVYLLSRRVLVPEALRHLAPEVPPESYASLPPSMMRRFEGDYAGKDLLKQLSYCEQEIYLRNQLLRDLGMVGVACDLDVRLPFADKDLVEAVWSLPASAVFLEGRPKTFLIECVKDVLPIEAYDRPKLGFVLPIGHWLSGAISSRLEELSAKTGLLEQLGIDPTTLKAIARDCAGAREKIFYNREWCLFVLLDWCARHL